MAERLAVRFVYPKRDFFNRPALQIQREAEDGSVWFGVEEAIVNYCEEIGLQIDQVEWKVKISRDAFASIKAKDIKDWKYKFDKLGVTFA